ncbi:hypothetical protein C900_04607 [Fulvivirga imtechensis AK7]|uniref:Uncharacterized protein n=1 Tax=Fulvivirga imtechensis AK7 TaxID=1237149 RepID=L8JQX9_9BACT|nr:hypothetical protein C900_04607 [Fulvivirga imtechensis AK7]
MRHIQALEGVKAILAHLWLLEKSFDPTANSVCQGSLCFMAKPSYGTFYFLFKPGASPRATKIWPFWGYIFF